MPLNGLHIPLRPSDLLRVRLPAKCIGWIAGLIQLMVTSAAWFYKRKVKVAMDNEIHWLHAGSITCFVDSFSRVGSACQTAKVDA